MPDITDKKNQHYIPKFYLRNFSYEGNGKQIGIYNVDKGFYFQQAKLKTQGSRNFFYGYDGTIEDRLADIEGDMAAIIRAVLNTSSVPEMRTPDYFELLTFVTLTDLRNPVRIDGMKRMFAEMRKRLLELDPNADVDKLVPVPGHDDLIRQFISGSSHICTTILDLHCKLLINRTANPFIASDFPIVKYNQYLEFRRWPQSKTGYGATGLQIFVPLSSDVLLVLYDSAIYSVGNDASTTCMITNERDVDELNKLQFLNCLETIYFSDRASEAYIRELHAQSKYFNRANVTKSELSYLVKENDEENKRTIDAGFKNFMVLNTTDCEINLHLESIKIHLKGLFHQLNNTMAQLRPYVQKMKNL